MIDSEKDEKEIRKQIEKIFKDKVVKNVKNDVSIVKSNFVKFAQTGLELVVYTLMFIVYMGLLIEHFSWSFLILSIVFIFLLYLFFEYYKNVNQQIINNPNSVEKAMSNKPNMKNICNYSAFL
ncbi:MAG: hypothetical protein K8R19_12070 [Methanosarcinales archaeon]|nr:hypothetical protein [Methanosarcinales archaeon]